MWTSSSFYFLSESQTTKTRQINLCSYLSISTHQTLFCYHSLKLEFSVHIFEELRIPKSPLEIYWPLALDVSSCCSAFSSFDFEFIIIQILFNFTIEENFPTNFSQFFFLNFLFTLCVAHQNGSDSNHFLTHVSRKRPKLWYVLFFCKKFSLETLLIYWASCSYCKWRKFSNHSIFFILFFV